MYLYQFLLYQDMLVAMFAHLYFSSSDFDGCSNVSKFQPKVHHHYHYHYHHHYHHHHHHHWHIRQINLNLLRQGTIGVFCQKRLSQKL